jgi:hypothetical protein
VSSISTSNKAKPSWASKCKRPLHSGLFSSDY